MGVVEEANYLGIQEKIRSLPARLIPKERMEPKVPENIFDIVCLNDRIWKIQLEKRKKYASFMESIYPQKSAIPQIICH